MRSARRLRESGWSVFKTRAMRERNSGSAFPVRFLRNWGSAEVRKKWKEQAEAGSPRRAGSYPEHVIHDAVAFVSEQRKVRIHRAGCS